MKKVKILAAAIVILCVMAFPSVISSAATCGETVRQNTEAALKAVDYDNSDQIAKLLGLSWYPPDERTNKQKEIALRDGRNWWEVTLDEAILELQKDSVKTMPFDDSFKEAQEQIGSIVQRIVDNTAGAESKGAATFTTKILNNKEKFLLGIAYIKRLYDFNMGEKNICDVLLYEPGKYGIQTDVVDWLIKIGSAGGDTLKLSNSANVFGYGKLFGDVSGSTNLGDFLETNRRLFIPKTSIDEWFLSASHAVIVEELSDWNSSANTGLYSKLRNDAHLQSHILPLLNVSDDSVYVIATTATLTYGIVDCYVDLKLKNTNPALYRQMKEKFEKDLEDTARQQRAFLDLWSRLTEPELREQLVSNRTVIDSLRFYADATVSAEAMWSAKYGKEAATGVREFFSPLNLYAEFLGVDGMADGEGVRYYRSKALTERGLSTYAHELTHVLVSKMMLNGYSSRDGIMGEVYTRGMFEPYESNDPPAVNLNLIYDRQAYNERFHNAVPERFQSDADLQEYMSGILDVVYTLDYAEADVIVSKTPEEKKKWFHKLEQVPDTNNRANQGDAGSVHYLDSVRVLTLDEAKELNTLEDLIRDSIITSRYQVNGTVTTGTMTNNGYYVVPLFSANYAGVQNDKGVSGDIMIRRQAFELLAEYGYDAGMVPYISNQYKEAALADQTILSDTYILNKIFGSTYSSMADFKLAMFQKRIDKVGKLKPVTISWNNESVTIGDFQTLEQLMKEAVESDLINVNVQPGGSNNIRAPQTQVERLKAEIFRAYLFQTDDFRKSVYSDEKEPEEPDPKPPVISQEPPTITKQPQNAAVSVGKTSTFTAAAVGEPAPTYQWQMSKNNGTDWENISGATDSTYTITAATMSMNGWQYRCIATNSGGSATSNAATLNVQKATPVPTTPTGLTATYGQTLADVVLPDGWTWDTPTTFVGDVGDKTFPATFTPTDTNNYDIVTQNLTVAVSAASRTITVTGQADSSMQVTLNDAVITPSGTGGTVQYGMSATNTAPDTWQTEKVFSSLTEDTTYYFFAKVEADGNYAAAASTGVAITTPSKDESGMKQSFKEELENYKNIADYREEQKEELLNAIAAGKAAIEAATDEEGVKSALAYAKALIDAIKTDAQLTLEEQNPALGNLKPNTGNQDTQDTSISNPKGTSIKGKLKAKANSFTVKWKKAESVTGYQIQYSTSKKFTKKTTKIKIVKKASKTKLTVKKLNSGKKYYVRIRTYKMVNDTSYYSEWSKAKTVKLKK